MIHDEPTATPLVVSPPSLQPQERPQPQSAPLVRETEGFTFTGSGAEYFRIWLVNLVLTIATLGIYSAWAKVRRLQYFYRNTSLGGAVFDFHGSPKAILKGRIVALVMFVSYQKAFGFSLMAGTVTLAILLLTLPAMLRSALRFRLRSTSYRGLRFDFAGSLAGAYSAYLPVLLVILLPGAVIAAYPTEPRLWLPAFLLYFCWPLLHARMKRYQQDNLCYGGHKSSYAGSSGAFYRYYAAAFGLTIGVLLAVAVCTTVATLVFGRFGSFVTGLLIGLGFFLGYIGALSSLPYLEARIHNYAWSYTRLSHLEVRSFLPAGENLKLALRNAVLTLLTMGLWRPWAAVKRIQLRLEYSSLVSAIGFEGLLAQAARSAGNASGEGSADLFGFDLSF